jgi:5'-nucleotidase
MRGRTVFGVLVALSLAVALLATASVGSARPDKPPKPRPPVNVQILGINDFHGQLQPIPPASSSNGRIGATPAGGVEYLDTHIQQLKATNPNSVVVSAGDLIGASPLISALFHDEPTIESMNILGLDFNGVGNHEFDEGPAELLRMQNGGCHPVDGCQDGDAFLGAQFQFLGANVAWASNGKTIFPPYKVRSFAGARIAFIGMTLEGTPSIVTPSGVAGLQFMDEVQTVNSLVPELKSKGIETIVVLLHEGGNTATNVFSETTINTCNSPTGPAVDITRGLDPEVDVVITGHTNWAVNCVIDGKIMTGARNIGRLVTDIDLTLDGATGEVIGAAVNNKIVTQDVVKDPDQTALIAKYDVLVAPLRDRVIGSITADITRTQNLAGESAMGDVIADAQLDATDDPGFGDAVIAFMNAGGIRNDLVYSQSSGGEAPGQVTYGEAFNVQPFGNSLVTMTLSGAQIEQVLERQFTGGIGILQVSDGFTYTYTQAAATGDKIDSATIKLDGVTIDPAGSYRVTVNSFLADGGDNYATFRDGTSRLGGDVDLDALEKYLTQHAPVAPGPQNRITRIG